MSRRQVNAADLGKVAHALADLTERVERLEQLHADRANPAVAEAAAVIEDALVALARTANLSSDEPAG